MKHVKIGCQIIAALILITTVVNWQSAFIPLRIVYYLQELNGFAIFLASIGILFVLLNLAASLGLFWLKNWGFAVAYTAIIFSTLFLSVSYIPFVSKLIPPAYSSASLCIINIAVLLVLVYLHVMIRKVGKRKVVRKRTTTRKKAAKRASK